jgi:hypothetical protein
VREELLGAKSIEARMMPLTFAIDRCNPAILRG